MLSETDELNKFIENLAALSKTEHPSFWDEIEYVNFTGLSFQSCLSLLACSMPKLQRVDLFCSDQSDNFPNVKPIDSVKEVFFCYMSKDENLKYMFQIFPNVEKFQLVISDELNTKIESKTLKNIKIQFD